MTKEFCDLCGEELWRGRHHRRFKIKELKCVDNGFEPQTVRWVDIVAHDSCIMKLLRMEGEKNEAD